MSRFSSSRVILAGLSLFLVALALIVAALAQSAMIVFLAGTVAGRRRRRRHLPRQPGHGQRLAPADTARAVLSAFFVACYAGLIIPVVGVGVLSGFTGTFTAVLTFSVLLAALCAFSIGRLARVVAAGGTR